VEAAAKRLQNCHAVLGYYMASLVRRALAVLVPLALGVGVEGTARRVARTAVEKSAKAPSLPLKAPKAQPTKHLGDQTATSDTQKRLQAFLPMMA
jgi:hypothetical protein